MYTDTWLDSNRLIAVASYFVINEMKMIKAMFSNRKNVFAFKAFKQQASDAKLFSTNY